MTDKLMERICGVILAGGASSRMGAEKAFSALSGRPMIAHVIERLAPQVDQLVISANGAPARFAAFGLPLLADPIAEPGAERQGPLAGLLAALRYAKAEGFAALVTAPADAPFLPASLISRLCAAHSSHHLVCLARSASGLEPLFGLWRTAALAGAETAFVHGERAMHRLAASLGYAEAAFTSEGDAIGFANVNSPTELEEARRRLSADPFVG